MAWNSAWKDIQPGEFEAWQYRVRAAGENPDRYDRKKTGQPGGRFFNVVWDRRYGGDLEGVIEQLDYLSGLGVNSIYLNPVFEAVSMHKYDTADFRHVDDNFGGDLRPPAMWRPDPDELYDDPSTWKWTAADRVFIRLLDEAHGRGMRIIIDGVFNHVGRNHPAFQDVMKRGKESPFARWFVAKFDQRGRIESWTAWDGPNGWLPKLAQNDDRSLIAPVARHIFDITRRWMDPNGDGDPSDGVDGWRLDVPLDVGDPFWRDWCAFVRSINPDAYIVAEIWTDSEAKPRLRGDMFNAQMHYPFSGAVIDWLANDPAMTGRDLATRLDAAFGNDASATQLVQQNLLASHDTDRIVSRLFNARPGFTFDSRNRPQDGEEYDERKPDARAYALNRLALVLQATYLGAPMIYYGEEIGMFGADDPSCRKPRPWPDLPEMVDPDDRPDYKLEAWYRKWLTLRRESDVLQLGMVRHLDTHRADVFAFERRLNESALLVVINRGEIPFEVAGLGGAYATSTETVAPLGAFVMDATSQ
jgi:glycosidase